MIMVPDDSEAGDLLRDRTDEKPVNWIISETPSIVLEAHVHSWECYSDHTDPSITYLVSNYNFLFEVSFRPIEIFLIIIDVVQYIKRPRTRRGIRPRGEMITRRKDVRETVAVQRRIVDGGGICSVDDGGWTWRRINIIHGCIHNI